MKLQILADALVFPLFFAVYVSPATAEEQVPPRYAVKVQINVKVPMRDGVNLAADIVRPDAPGKFPALLLRTYHVGNVRMASYFAPLGYAVVLVDVRGRYDSEGVFEMGI